MTRVEFNRYETYLDIINFPSEWEEVEFSNFLKKHSEEKISRVVVHKTEPLHATLVFDGSIDLQSLVQKISNKVVIPGCDVPVEIKICGEDSLKVQVAMNSGEKKLQEVIRRTEGLKRNDWMKKPYKNHSIRYVLTYKTRDAAVNAYEVLTSYVKTKELQAIVELYDTIPRKDKSDTSEGNLFNKVRPIKQSKYREYNKTYTSYV